MTDLNWCTYCDNAIHPYSNSLYCSEECLRADALNHHPLLGYDYAELKDFPRCSSHTAFPSPALTATSSSSSASSPQSKAHHSHSPSLSPICLTSAHSFKEPPILLLNSSTHEDIVYQTIYNTQEQKKNKPQEQPAAPIFLHAWNHIPRPAMTH